MYDTCKKLCEVTHLKVVLTVQGCSQNIAVLQSTYFNFMSLIMVMVDDHGMISIILLQKYFSVTEINTHVFLRSFHIHTIQTFNLSPNYT